MNIREITAKNTHRTGIEGYDYCLNPYVGCGWMRYCYATFMKRFTGHSNHGATSST